MWAGTSADVPAHIRAKRTMFVSVGQFRLLNRSGGLLHGRVGHDGGVHTADLPLDEVQMGTGPGPFAPQAPDLPPDPPGPSHAGEQSFAGVGAGAGRPLAGPVST